MFNAEIEDVEGATKVSLLLIANAFIHSSFTIEHCDVWSGMGDAENIVSYWYASMLKKKTKLIGIRGGMWLLRALCGIFGGKERLRGKNFLGWKNKFWFCLYFILWTLSLWIFIFFVLIFPPHNGRRVYTCMLKLWSKIVVQLFLINCNYYY